VLVLIEIPRIVLQHREGIYWCPAPLRDDDRRSYKVRDAADMQAAPAPPIDKYISDLTVGSDDEAPTMSRRAPSMVATPRRTRQTAGKISASRAATQAAETKKKRKRTRSAVSVDTTMISLDVETIDVDDREGDVELPKETTAPSAGTPRRAATLGKQAVETPRQALSHLIFQRTKCISYVCQDQVYTHMIDVMSEISINSNKNVQELNHYIISLLHSDDRLEGLYND
jgi:hypothetical protein